MLQKHQVRIILAAALASLAIGAAAALPPGDLEFVARAAKGSMADVELGQLAQQRATHPMVKAFGERMANDHANATEELRALATKKGVALPATMDMSKKRDVLELQKIAVDKFDQEFIEQMVKDQRGEVKEFEKQAAAAKDPDVKAWAAKSLPVLQQQLKLAEAAQAAVRK